MENTKKSFVGIVKSDKMSKSRVVVVEGVRKHPIYGKYLKSRKKFMAHDEQNLSKEGDRVLLEETRPMSSRKKWTIIQVIGQAE